MYEFWPDIYPGSDSSVDGSSYEGSKYQENLDKQEHEVVSDPRSNPKSIIQDEQRGLRQLKREIGSSEDKLFFIKHTSEVSTQDKW